ncbi:MAG: glycerophosphodiester phosphodiesterase family protein [Gammaproteobacteria bacterium]|nr:glycerophosphodiester phosphodiesterase family protein [Gammaproteobacteria bacterium]
MAERPPFLCIGHRGAMGYRPENTLPAFELALAMGCPWVELDVHLCEDERIVIHDDSLERTTNGTGRVSGVELDDPRSLDAGDGARVPTLAEVIEFIDGRAGINIELKGKGTGPAVSRLLTDYCESAHHPDEFLLSSFSHDELRVADARFSRGALWPPQRRQPHTPGNRPWRPGR